MSDILSVGEAAKPIRASSPSVIMLCDAGKLEVVSLSADGHRSIASTSVQHYLVQLQLQNGDAPTVAALEMLVSGH